jgi:hypothetical protein
MLVTDAEAAVLLRRQEIVGELQLEGDVRSEWHEMPLVCLEY